MINRDIHNNSPINRDSHDNAWAASELVERPAHAKA